MLEFKAGSSFYDRSKAYLVSFSLLFSLSLPALATGHDFIDHNSSNDSRLIALIAIAFAANVFIPLIRYAWKIHVLRKSFLVFMKVNVAHTIQEYGDTFSVEAAIKHLDINEIKPYRRNLSVDEIVSAQSNTNEVNHEWLSYLKAQKQLVPKTMIDMHKALVRAFSAQGHEAGYIPYITYSAMDPVDIDHTNPIWMLRPGDSKLISRYLVAQKGIRSNLEDQYSEKILELIKSKNPMDRKRWIDSCLVLLEDLAKLYVHAKTLEHRLENI